MMRSGEAYSSRWNSYEVSQIGKFGVFPLRRTCSASVDGPAPWSDSENLDSSSASTALTMKEDIVDEALLCLKPLILLQNINLEGPGDFVLLSLCLFLHHCLQSIQDADRMKAFAVMSALRYTYADKLAYCQTEGPFRFLYSTMSSSNTELLETYFIQLFTEAASRLLDRVFSYPSNDGKGNKFWLVFGRKQFLGCQLS